MSTAQWPIAGRHVGILVTDGCDLAGATKLRAALSAEGANCYLVAPHGGTAGRGRVSETVDRTFLTTRSIEFDAVVAADGTGGIDDVRVVVLLQETYRHCKAIGAWGDGADLLARAGIHAGEPGVLVSKKASSSHRKDLIKAMGRHREWSGVLKVV